MSNAVYKVYINDAALSHVEPQVLLYRKFECDFIDRNREHIIFKMMSDNKLGPELHYQDDEYRIESFFNGRPLTIWEM